MPHRALILVDLQNDFMPGGALGVHEGDAVLAVANRVQDAFAMVVASKDWHPGDHCSFAANHPGRRVGEVVEVQGLPQILWPAHCVKGTHGAEFAPGLKTGRIEHVFLKGTEREIDSYSALFDNGHRKSTGLGEYLRERGVASVYLLGLATDYCVHFTALDAVEAGFEVFVIEDGCRGVNLKPNDSAAALDEIRRAGGHIIRSETLEDQAE